MATDINLMHWPKKVAIGLISVYRYVISPWLPPSCRFTPTCSRYASDAIERYGLLKGLYLTVKRIARCHPFARGGYDPLP